MSYAPEIKRPDPQETRAFTRLLDLAEVHGYRAVLHFRKGSFCLEIWDAAKKVVDVRSVYEAPRAFRVLGERGITLLRKAGRI